MTNEQINQQIAKACGWKWHDHPECMAKKIDWSMPERWIMRLDGTLCFKHDIPNYCADLNAMHEAEKMLTYEQCAFFRTHLRERIEDHAALLFVWHATARQRAEAFLRTLGKWEEV